MLDHEYATMRQVEDHHWWYRTLRNMVVREVRPLVAAAPGLHILDAGCGTGGMLHRLREACPTAILHAIDYAPAAVASTRARGFPGVEEGSINQLPFDPASMDMILCLDVLYHAAVDEQLALAGCHRVLKPGGTLVLNLPAYAVLRGRHDEAVSGVRRYRPARLRALLTGAGFEVITVHAWNAWLFFPMLVLRQWSRHRRPAQPAGAAGDLTLTSPALNPLLAPLGALDTRLSRWLGNPLGTSLYAIARRP